MRYVLAIDPGNNESGIALLNSDYRPVFKAKLDNHEILKAFTLQSIYTSEEPINPVLEYIQKIDEVVIEMVSHYGSGMSAGKTVFDTCVWIGRFAEHFLLMGRSVTLMERRYVKLGLCGTSIAKDSNVTQALIDRFAYGVSNHGKGKKKQQGWFFGFKADIWQAYAIGVVYIDLIKAEDHKNMEVL